MAGEKNWRSIKLAVHPFFIATLPILFLLSFTKDEILLEETFSSLFGVELLAALLFAVAYAFIRKIEKASIAASLLLVLMFSYRIWQVYIGMYMADAENQPWVPLLSFFCLCAFTLFVVMRGNYRFGSFKFSLDYERMNGALNVISVLLFVINSIPIVSFEMEMQSVVKSEVTELAKPFAGLKLDRNASKPDVYYIILDGFASPYTLEQFWNYKDPGLIKFLTDNGFYVVPRALSNYDRTEMSLCSSLNMSYIEDIEKRSQERSKKEVNGLVQMRLIQDCVTVRLFKELGYRYVSISSGSFGTDNILTADQVIKANDVNHFARALAYLTPWWSVEYYVPWLRNCYCDTRLVTGTKMPQILANKSPKFVFIHTDLPHAPNLFDAAGNRLKLPAGLLPIWEPASACYAQWCFCASSVEGWISAIKKASDGKAIIIVQSDHGSGLVMKKPLDWYNERMRILNAYYLPGHKIDVPPTITPVNTFRMIFRDYFAAPIPPLNDRSMCSPEWTKPFASHDVTQEVSFPPAAYESNKLEGQNK